YIYQSIYFLIHLPLSIFILFPYTTLFRSSYLWSNGATTQTINVSGAGSYWVIVGMNNCLAKDTVKTFITPGVQLFDSSLCTMSPDRKSTRLNSSHLGISYAVFCLKKKTKN